MKKLVLEGIWILFLLILLAETNADMSCEVTTTCSYTDIFHISNLTNAHAELNNNSNYNQIVCCRDTNSIAALGTGNTGNYTTLLHLSTETDAHVELNNASNYPIFLYLNTSSGNISCAYAANCNAYNTCIASVSTEFTGDSDLHVADCTTDPYATKICCNLTTAANNAPVINDISNIPSQSITEAGINYVEFSVLASDENGVANLNDNSLNATFSKSGETTRFNSSCSWLSDINTTTANYTCTIGLWYWDGAGTWDVNATILDLSNAQSPAYNETFTLSETTAMVMSPNSLGWATLFPGGLDKLSNNDPIIINNTGNKDITSGNVRVKAYDLTGETNPSYIIPAANFTVNVDDACEGTQMQNNTAIGIAGSISPAGNNSAGNGQEQLYFCLEEVPNIIQQAYSTVLNWVIDIT